MAAPRKYPDELRERATRMAVESAAGPGDEVGRDLRGWPSQLGMHPETLRNWVRQAEIDGGDAAGHDYRSMRSGSPSWSGRSGSCGARTTS